MLRDMLSFLCQRLFGSTQCKPVEGQLPGENPTGTAGNNGELHAGLQGNILHSSACKETGRGNVTPKKTTVLIMVAPPTDLQQVGYSR